MGTVVQTGEEIDRMMAGTGGAVGLLLDTGHATWAGVDPAALARRHRSRVVHLHAKDVRAEVAAHAAAEDWPFLASVQAGVSTAPGGGSGDYLPRCRSRPASPRLVVLAVRRDTATG